MAVPFGLPRISAVNLITALECCELTDVGKIEFCLYAFGKNSNHPSRVYRVSFLYFTRCGMMLSWPSRRILSFS
jgi:hypothetical protein